MKKIRIAVIDYGMGNLRSVSKALDCAGADALVTDDPKKILSAAAIVFPGVGSFGPAVRNLKANGLDEVILESTSRKKHFLGLCLGFQLLFDRSYEEGRHAGLGAIAGEVKRFNFAGKNKDLRIPHMGWNTVTLSKSAGASKMFNGVKDGTFFYFVHSYYGAPKDKALVAGSTDYGIKFCSAIVEDNIWACQFHPEKSGDNGLKLLKNFVNEVKKC